MPAGQAAPHLKVPLSRLQVERVLASFLRPPQWRLLLGKLPEQPRFMVLCAARCLHSAALVCTRHTAASLAGTRPRRGSQ